MKLRSTLIILIYSILLACTVLIVPWTYTKGEIRYEREFAFLFTNMGRKSIDYGMIVLEVVALSCMASVAYLLREYFDNISMLFYRLSKKPTTVKLPHIDDGSTAEERKASKAYWEKYWDEDLVFAGRHLTRYRIVMWFIGCLILIYLVSTLSK